MKYIKEFNEKLDPNTYRRAASRLSYYNKDKKSKELYDWADEREFGYYNVHFANDGGIILKNGVFTEPKLTGIYFGTKIQPVDGKRDGNNLLQSKNLDVQAEKAVQNWANGIDGLSIIMEFGLRPTADTKSKKKHSYLDNPSQARRFYSRHVPLFSIELNLSDWYEGISGWDEESKFQAEINHEEFNDSTVYDLYSGSKEENLILIRPNDEHYYGLFADRQSANKFLKFLKELITRDKNPIKDRIMDILSIVDADASDIERIIKEFSKIRVHGLYDSEVDSQSKISNKWFCVNLVNW
jgi:hypothetical protein